MQPDYTTAVSRHSEHSRIWRWVVYKDCVEFRAGLSNTQKAAQSDADACLKYFQKPAVELTKREPAHPRMITTPDLLRILNLIPVDSLEDEQQHRLTGWMIYLKERINAPAHEHWIECVLEIVRVSQH